MTTIRKIIEIFGGLDALKKHTVNVRVPGHPTLTIEFIGYCNGTWPMVAVSHYLDDKTIQTVEIAIDPAGKWLPLLYQRAGKEITAATVRQSDQRLITWPEVQKEIAGYLRLWSNELKERGYLKAARIQSKHPHN